METQRKTPAPAATSRHPDAICDHFLSERGATCDFKHPTAPDGTITNRVCEFWGSPRGCLKQGECKYLHPIRYNPIGEPATRVCDFFLTRQGCVKSNSCDYLHPKAVPALYNMTGSGRGLDSLGIKRTGGVISARHRGPIDAATTTSSAAGSSSSAPVVPAQSSETHTNSQVGTRLCRYFSNGSEGCRRGDGCTFKHVSPTSSSASNDHPAASTSSANGTNVNSPTDSQRKPNILRGGVGSRGTSIVPSIHKLPRPCQFFATKEGCKKGDLCDFVHMRNRPCDFFKQGTCKKGAACDFVHAES